MEGQQTQENIDANLLLQAVEMQRNQATNQAAMSIARSTQLANEVEALKRRVAELESELKAPKE